MDVRRDPARRVLLGLPPAGFTSAQGVDATGFGGGLDAGLGMTMLTPLDLASLFAPLFVLCGVHNAPEITPMFTYYLVGAAKIWAGTNEPSLCFPFSRA